jgi:hypothetical protein
MAAKTRFRIFLQPPYVPGFEEPATVEIETEDQIEAGPTDSLLYVLDAENKPSYRAQAPHAYQRFRGRPWKGALNRVIARPGHDGHFDHLTPDDPAFPAASVYATARLTLNFWNRIFKDADLDELNAWHHEPDKLAEEEEDYRLAGRLQLVPRCGSTGSRTGYGYLEVGQDNPGHRYRPRPDGPERLTYQRGAMWQNFDVIAHEVGHAILFRRVGFPAGATKDVRDWFAIPEPEFLAFHESMADLVAILSLLDVEAARQFILTRRNGIDIAAGVGELQRLDAMGFLPIRSALNESKYPGPGRFKNEEAHTNSMSLTGAVFDTLKRAYEARRMLSATATPVDSSTALAEARDIVARALARLWASPEYLWEQPANPSGFSFIKVSKALPTLVSEEFERQGHGPASQGIAMSDLKGALRPEAIVKEFDGHGLG